MPTRLLFRAIFALSLLMGACAPDALAQAADTLQARQTVQRDTQRKIDQREFSGEAIENLKADEDYRYEQPPPSDTDSLWTRIKRWLFGWIFRMLIDDEASVPFKWTIYTLCGTAILYLILKLVGADLKGMFYRSSDRQSVQADWSEEDLHERDFMTEIKQTVDEQRYQEAVRLQYLHVLQLLSARGLIQWKIDKTNQEYAVEISPPSLRKPFSRITYLFESAYYGDFPITSALYTKAARNFEAFKAEISAKQSA